MSKKKKKILKSWKCNWVKQWGNITSAVEKNPVKMTGFVVWLRLSNPEGPVHQTHPSPSSLPIVTSHFHERRSNPFPPLKAAFLLYSTFRNHPAGIQEASSGNYFPFGPIWAHCNSVQFWVKINQPEQSQTENVVLGNRSFQGGVLIQELFINENDFF